MAANGARKGQLSRMHPSSRFAPTNSVTAPPTPAATQKLGLINPDIVREALKDGKDDKDKKITLKLKKAAPKSSIPGNWKESEALSRFMSTFIYIQPHSGVFSMSQVVANT
jgi:hypothetical protein